MKKWIFGALILILVAIRIVLPSIILKDLNSYFATFSPVYLVHIEDLDLNFYRSAYLLKGLDMNLKKSNKNVFHARGIDVSISWGELLRGEVLTDVIVDGAKLVLTPELWQDSKEKPKDREKEAVQAKNKLLPVRVSRIDVKDCSIIWGLTDSAVLGELEGRISDLTPTSHEVNPLFNFRGKVLGHADLKFFGHFNPEVKPLPWDLSLALRDLKLPSLNKIFDKRIPISFVRGDGQLYLDARSQNGTLEGIAKPFIKDMKLVGNENDFRSFAQFVTEIGLAAVNLFFERSDDHSFATRLIFEYKDSHFKWNAREAIHEAYVHGYDHRLKAGNENNYLLQTIKEKANGK